MHVVKDVDIMRKGIFTGHGAHQYSHKLQSRRFLGRTGHSVDPSRWLYSGSDLPLYHTHR